MISDVSVVTQYCKDAIEMLKDDDDVAKYNSSKPKSNRNKRALTRIIDLVLHNSNNKAHTKVARTVILELMHSRKGTQLSKLSSN